MITKIMSYVLAGSIFFSSSCISKPPLREQPKYCANIKHENHLQLIDYLFCDNIQEEFETLQQKTQENTTSKISIYEQINIPNLDRLRDTYLEDLIKYKPRQRIIVEQPTRHENQKQNSKTLNKKLDSEKQVSVKRAVTYNSIPILMYHEIGAKKTPYFPRYQVSPEMFRKHLEYLYDKNYATISLEDYVNEEYKNLPEDKKPIVITFDDATEGQLRYLFDESGKPYLDPDCAVGVMLNFADEHPEFGNKATFFIDWVDKYGSFKVAFGQPGREKQKLKDLIMYGMEIGLHTERHVNLKQASTKKIKNEMKFNKYLISQILPEYPVKFLAVPYGGMPGQKGMKIIKNNIEYACAAWGGIAPLRTSKKSSNYRIPRIEINSDFKNLKNYVR